MPYENKKFNHLFVHFIKIQLAVRWQSSPVLSFVLCVHVHFVGYWDWLHHASWIRNASILTNACLNTTNETNIKQAPPIVSTTTHMCLLFGYIYRRERRVYGRIARLKKLYEETQRADKYGSIVCVRANERTNRRRSNK